jgi:PAS domain S-box-containing protein
MDKTSNGRQMSDDNDSRSPAGVLRAPRPEGRVSPFGGAGGSNDTAATTPEESYRVLFERNPHPMWVVDKETLAFLAVNEAAIAHYGYTRDEFLKMTIEDIRPKECVPELRRYVNELRNQPALPRLGSGGVWTHRRKDGTLIEAEIAWSIITFLGKDAFLTLVDDVTDRRRAEARLTKSEAQLLEAQHVAHLGSWEWDIPTNTVTWSDELYRIYGMRAQEIPMTYESFLERVHPEDREFTRRIVETAYQDHRPFRYDHRIVWTDGSVRTLHARGEVIADGTGAPVRMIGTALDITDRKRADEERSRLLAGERAARAEAETALLRLRSIQSVSEAALAHLALDDLLGELLTRIRSVLAADTATVLLLTEDGASLSVRASQGLEALAASDIVIPVGAGVAGRIAAGREPLIVEDLSRMEVVRPVLRESLRSLLGVPLLVEGQVIGVLHVATQTPRRFTESDLSLLQIVADRVAPAIDRARLFEEVRQGRERLQTLSRRLVELQEAERREIARELHDEVGQLLTGISLLLGSGGRSSRRGAGTARRGTPGRSRGRSRDRRAETIALVNELMGRVRDLSMNLRPRMLDELGLLAALRWHFERYTTQTGVGVDFRHAGLERRFSSEVETAAFRIVQEALTNVARHAGVAEARVDVRVEGRRLRIQIEDSGKGFDRRNAPAGAGGLTGMHERARLLGGRLKIESLPGSGARLTAELPVGGSSRRRPSRRFRSRPAPGP